MITAVLLLSVSTIAFAKSGHDKKHHDNQSVKKQEQQYKVTKKSENKAKKLQEKKTEELKKAELKKQQELKKQEKKQEEMKKASEKNQRIRAKKQDFKINGSPVIKYGRYKLPIRPIIMGMGAAVAFDKDTAVLTVTKGTTVIVINFKDKSVTINGVADTESGIFTAKNDKKMTVLIKYIAKALGIRTECGKDKITVEVPGLDFPTNISINTVGSVVTANTINTTTQYITAAATIISGQAAGGKAELYVGSKLVAVDHAIAASDSAVTFTTSDGTPTNEELRALIPHSGVVKVKLYNANNQYVYSKELNPKLIVDYKVPTVTSITSAVCDVTGSAITLNVTDAGKEGDKVDVTKLSLHDTASGNTYQLTSDALTGSTGVVNDEDEIVVTLGSADKLALADLGDTVTLNIAEGSLLFDAAGNTSIAFAEVKDIPVTVVK